MEYFPGMIGEQTMYEDMMEYEEEMTICQKDWDTILLTICHREVELQRRLRDSSWSEKQIEIWNEELSTLTNVKKKVIDKIR